MPLHRILPSNLISWRTDSGEGFGRWWGVEGGVAAEDDTSPVAPSRPGSTMAYSDTGDYSTVVTLYLAYLGFAGGLVPPASQSLSP
jgi:hypothetical protein